MTRARLLVIPFVALALWAGFRSYPSTSLRTGFEAAAAIAMGANLVFCLWVWSRAKPGSVDALAMRLMALLMVLMLVGVVPRLIWPDLDGLQMAASIVSATGITVLLMLLLRRRRRARRATPSA